MQEKHDIQVAKNDTTLLQEQITQQEHQEKVMVGLLKEPLHAVETSYHNEVARNKHYIGEGLDSLQLEQLQALEKQLMLSMQKVSSFRMEMTKRRATEKMENFRDQMK